MKILEICPFSSGGCGVWARAKYESLEFSKLGHKVAVFSSNVEKGTDRLADSKAQFGKVHVYRFDSEINHFANFLSKNVVYFNFEQELKDFSPDLVITHLLHPHSFQALEICRRMNIPIFIIPHAPFNVNRNLLLKFVTKVYNFFITEHKLKKFDKIIAITKWEYPSLKRLNVPEDKIVYIPNGIREEFFKEKEGKEKKQILYCGRIAPVKDIETLLRAFALLKNKSIKLKLLGKIEEGYSRKLNCLIEELKIAKQIEITDEVYEVEEQIKSLNESKIFVLPSKREAMPQVLIEAMARGKIVISSNTDGGKEIINDKKNGFLFEIGDIEQLAKLMKSGLRGKRKIKESAKRTARKYSWKKLIKDYEKLIEECYQ